MHIPDIEAHYKEHYTRLIKMLTWRAGTVWAAEDVLQSAYEMAIKYRKSCIPGAFPRWFATIVNNCLRKYKNEEKGYSTLEDIDEQAETSGCPHYSEQIMKEIFELIETKSVVQQEVLNMHFRYGYSPIDISNITENSYSNCHQIIQRFRNELKTLYRE